MLTNLGSRLKVLSATPAGYEKSPIESTITTISVANLRVGYVVVDIQADSFVGLPSDVPVTQYVVMSRTPPNYILTNLSDGSKACLRNPSMQVHVLNSKGIFLSLNSIYEGVKLCFPGEDVSASPLPPVSPLPPIDSRPSWEAASPTAARENALQNNPKNPYPQNTLGYSIWDMGYTDKSLVDAALAHTSTAEAAIEWMVSQPQKRQLMTPSGEQRNMPPVHQSSGVGGAPSRSQAASNPKGNPYPPGSRGQYIWDAGYTNKALVDESLSRSSTLEAAIDWIIQSQISALTVAKPEKQAFECPIYCTVVSDDQIYEFNCPMRHKSSLRAAFATVVDSALRSDSKSGCIVPSCPLQSCKYTLGQKEILSILDESFRQKLPDSPEFQQFLMGKSRDELSSLVSRACAAR